MALTIDIMHGHGPINEICIAKEELGKAVLVVHIAAKGIQYI